jgi:hypothetical protein
MNNPPAFPSLGDIHTEVAGIPVKYHAQLGMTLRDYFAAKALQGLLSNTAWVLEVAKQTSENKSFDTVNSSRAFAAADAMLEAREK